MVTPAVTTFDEAKNVIWNQAEEIERLSQENAWLKRQIFGAKAERFLPEPDGTQSLPGFEPPAAEESAPAPQKVAEHERAPRKENALGEIPADLPREERILDVPEAEREGLSLIGYAESERVAYRTGIFVIHYKRAKYADPEHPESGVVTAPAPGDFFDTDSGRTRYDASFVAKYEYNDNDQLLYEQSNSAGITRYDYDLNGALIHKYNTGKFDYLFSYNLQERLASAEINRIQGNQNISLEAKYLYDYLGNRARVTKTINGVSSQMKYLVDEDLRGYSRILEEIPMEDSAPTISYVYGREVISQTENIATQYLLHDGIKNMRQLIDSGALVLEAYHYDAYGNSLQEHSGNPLEQASTKIRYSGEEFDDIIQMQFLRARYYDQNTGRFNRLDPYMGDFYKPESLHKYNYANNDPINHKDPTGLFSLSEVMTQQSIRDILEKGLGYYNQAQKIYKLKKHFETANELWTSLEKIYKIFAAAATGDGFTLLVWKMLEDMKEDLDSPWKILDKLLTGAFDKIGDQWDDYVSAALGATGDMAADTFASGAVLTLINKPTAEPVLGLNLASPPFSVPMDVFEKGWTFTAKKGFKINICSQSNGGRLFGVGTRSETEKFINFVYIDYMNHDNYTNPIDAIQGHYSVYKSKADKKKCDHEHHQIFWTP